MYKKEEKVGLFVEFVILKEFVSSENHSRKIHLKLQNKGGKRRKKIKNRMKLNMAASVTTAIAVASSYWRVCHAFGGVTRRLSTNDVWM